VFSGSGGRVVVSGGSIRHKASHTTQPPSFRAAATTACVAARAAMPNSEDGSEACCVPSCPDCHVESQGFAALFNTLARTGLEPMCVYYSMCIVPVDKVRFKRGHL
jgi:hypothetical protein